MDWKVVVWLVLFSAGTVEAQEQVGMRCQLSPGNAPLFKKEETPSRTPAYRYQGEAPIEVKVVDCNGAVTPLSEVATTQLCVREAQLWLGGRRIGGWFYPKPTWLERNDEKVAFRFPPP
jgi:hypothetical protein